MTSSRDGHASAQRLRRAIVLSSTEEACTVVADGRSSVVAYALPFPRPRADRVAPGHLVALAVDSDGSELIVWRWFDAVVLDHSGDTVALWEPHHGSVVARPRDPYRVYRPGGRAYLSAGLPDAEWWVAGPAVDRAEESDVELGEVEQFLTGHGLWDRLA